MPVTEKKYPNWVQKYRAKGTTVKKKGDKYYLYKRTSRRVPGKKYPQPVDTYIGIITPDGVVESDRRMVSLSGIEVKEFGFSKAVEILCPDEWKEPLGEDWEDVLSILISKRSPETYLRKERQARSEEEYHYQFASQMGMLSRRIYKKHGVGLEELEQLKSIYLVYLGKEKVVSRISDAQRELLERLGIGDELYC